MPNCDRCENYFCQIAKTSPCAACLRKATPNGYRRAKLSTQIRICLHQLNLILRGGR